MVVPEAKQGRQQIPQGRYYCLFNQSSEMLLCSAYHADNDCITVQFYEGKRRALAGSTFALMNDPDYDEEVLYARENKARETNEAALFKSMFPDCSTEELAEFRMHLHETNHFPRLSSSPSPGGGGGGGVTATPPDESAPPSSIIESRRTRDLHAVMDWQQYTVTKLLQNKTGPKKTLPVVVVKYEGKRSFFYHRTDASMLLQNTSDLHTRLNVSYYCTYKADAAASGSLSIRPSDGAVERWFPSRRRTQDSRYWVHPPIWSSSRRQAKCI